MCFLVSENETAASNVFVNDCLGELTASELSVLGFAFLSHSGAEHFGIFVDDKESRRDRMQIE